MCPYSCKELPTITLSSVHVLVASRGHNQCRERMVRTQMCLCSSSFKKLQSAPFKAFRAHGNSGTLAKNQAVS